MNFFTKFSFIACNALSKVKYCKFWTACKLIGHLFADPERPLRKILRVLWLTMLAAIVYNVFEKLGYFAPLVHKVLISFKEYRLRCGPFRIHLCIFDVILAHKDFIFANSFPASGFFVKIRIKSILFILFSVWFVIAYTVLYMQVLFIHWAAG